MFWRSGLPSSLPFEDEDNTHLLNAINCLPTDTISHPRWPESWKYYCKNLKICKICFVCTHTHTHTHIYIYVTRNKVQNIWQCQLKCHMEDEQIFTDGSKWSLAKVWPHNKGADVILLRLSSRVSTLVIEELIKLEHRFIRSVIYGSKNIHTQSVFLFWFRNPGSLTTFSDAVCKCKSLRR